MAGDGVRAEERSARSPAALRLSVVIPAFNEEALVDALLGRVTEALQGWDAEVVAVDDGSTDGTFPALQAWSRRDARIRVLRHGENRGKAAAIRSALAELRGELVLIQDADLEYSPGDYGALLAPFEDPSVEAVYGSRFLQRTWPSRMAAPNWIANRVFSAAANALYRGRLTDEGTGIKAFRAEVLRTAGIASSRFEFCPEITAKLLKRGARIVEVPIAYSARARGEGKKPGLLDGLAVLWTLVKYRFME